MPKALTMRQIEGKPGKVYYPLEITTTPPPTPSPHDLVIHMLASALNHRDHFLRQHLYPSPSFTTPLLADGCGIVTALGASASKSWLGKTVILMPGRGWASSIHGPEKIQDYAILGGTSSFPLGTAQDVLVVDENEVEEAPGHLSAVQAAAFPLVGLTGWRALVTKSGEAVEGRNILITGIGGGVALSVLQFAVAVGMNVFVTSGDEGKIEKAMELGARGGVSYKREKWEGELLRMLPEGRKWVDTVVDGAGGGIVGKAVKLLKPGGTIVQYGMTLSPKMDWSMNAVLKNIDLKGSTMGSRKEFKDMVAFVNEKKIVPVVSRVVKGLENLEEIEGLFEDIKSGKQFGKLVIEISDGKAGKGGKSKL